MIQILRQALGCQVEIEFALDYHQTENGKRPCLYVLQTRPLSGQHVFQANIVLARATVSICRRTLTGR